MGKIEDKYKKLSQIEHVLQRPGMYIGSLETEVKKMLVVKDINSENIEITEKLTKYNPGYFKLFDEILVNASDHYIRTNGKVKYIKINVEKDHISVENDGKGIPIQLHKEHNIYIPELIFANLLSGENFSDDERITGGLHGLGAKCVNIYSNKFIIETCDGKKKYIQDFENNLSKINKPKISTSKKNYTKITYYPDFERFGLTENTEEMEQLFYKRCLDISAYCPDVKVYYNNKLINVNNFSDYIKAHTDNDEIFYERLNENWEIGITKSSNDNFNQVSLVNGINTYIGGTHVNFITNQLVSGIQELLKKKHKKITIKPNDIKNKLFIFVNSKIVNPSFDSQTKENLKTRLLQKHTEGAEVSQKLLKDLLKSDIIEEILNYIEIREKAELKRLNKGKTSKVKVKKLDDANRAGTLESEKCLLFLAEGDSAAGTVLTGFASTGRDYYGCFPLKGKPLNVKDTSSAKIKANDEIKHIIEALGLEFGKKYTSTKELRYGKVVIMSDADVDGTHIKGLIINLFDTFWPELLKLDFIYEFITPIVKIEKGKNVKFFYKLDEYNKWKKSNQSGWSITYYKGLGTIEPHEAKEFFANINKHLIRFNYDNEENTKKYIDLVFLKKNADNRKNWLLNYKPGVEIDKFSEKTTYETFFDKEFIEFSMSDNIRSIPNIMDGLKPSQRKILYTMFKKNFKGKTKVSQLGGSITEVSAYHHGPASLEGGIVNMAQNFISSNNINLIEPLGQFGTRLKGGKDAASGRYIFTRLDEIARFIYKSEDDNILNYLNDDGYPIEPDFYVPIIPMVLVNGADGIGTGWSTDIPKYNPNELIKYIGCKLKKQKLPTLQPYYNKFKGTIIPDENNNRYITKGIITKKNTTSLNITELPIGMWNDKYYDILDKLIDKKIIKDYKKQDTDENVNITISVSREQMKNLENTNYKDLLLETFISYNNMHLFNKLGQIKKYDTIYEILDEFFDVRLEYYQKRKDYILYKLNYDKNVLTNRMKFINHILKDELKIQKVKRETIEKNLEKLGIDRIDDSYNYLLNMSIVSLTVEKLSELKEQFKNKKIDIEQTEKTSIEQMWLTDLGELFKKIKKRF